MKKLLYVVTIALSISGCEQFEVDNTGCTITLYDTSVDKVGESGLLLKPSKSMYVKFSQIEKFYQETQQCVGITATGPTVEFVDFREKQIGGAWAAYSSATQTVYVNTGMEDPFVRDCKTDEEALKHEFVHHLVYLAGGSKGQNRGHDSPYFEKCGVGVNVNN